MLSVTLFNSFNKLKKNYKFNFEMSTTVLFQIHKNYDSTFTNLTKSIKSTAVISHCIPVFVFGQREKTKAEKKDENFFKFVINSLLLFFIMLLSFLASFLQCFLFVLSSFRSWNVFEREIWNRLRQNRPKNS